MMKLRMKLKKEPEHHAQSVGYPAVYDASDHDKNVLCGYFMAFYSTEDPQLALFAVD